MSILSKATTGRRGRAQKIVIYGPEGFGKSTLAGEFPNPLFLDVEDSTSQLDVRRVSRADLPDIKAIEAALDEVIKTAACETLVLDTADWLEQMATDAIIAEANNAKITGIEDFGYGKGYTILREKMTVLLARFDRVIAAGIHVVLLAHSKVVKFEPPDGAGPYDRYELKLSKQVAPLIKEWADALLFGNWRTQVRERDKHESGAQFKGVGGKDRVLYCNRCAAWDAKNRHNLGDAEKWGIEVLKKACLAVGAPWGNGVHPPQNLPVQTTEATSASGAAGNLGASSPQGDAALATPPTADAKAAELERICAPHAEAVNAYLLGNGKIKAGQDWRAMDAGFAARVLKNPAGFLKIVNGGREVSK